MECTKGECGCRIVHLEYGELEIEYCPLHKSAPDLYKACKTAFNELLHAGRGDRLDELEHAIAKAEGGQ